MKENNKSQRAVFLDEKTRKSLKRPIILDPSGNVITLHEKQILLELQPRDRFDESFIKSSDE